MSAHIDIYQYWYTGGKQTSAHQPNDVSVGLLLKPVTLFNEHDSVSWRYTKEFDLI